MLYLNEPQEIEGCTVYPDSAQDNVFYPIAAMPRFRRDENGKPVFHLLKFRGGDASTAPRVEASKDGEEDAITANSVPTLDGEAAGGILMFDTEFSLDEEVKQKISTKLDEQVRAKYLAAGRPIPDGWQIVLGQPQWTDGTVELLMEDTANGLFESVSKAGKPSLMGKNVASFAAVMRPWQASLVEEAVTPPANFTPLQVAYDLKFLAKLPPVRISIYASALDAYNMYKEYENYYNYGTCGEASRQTIISAISEVVRSRDVVRISIDSGGLTIDNETFKKLQDMAMGLVQQWIQTEFLKPPPARATAEQLNSIDLKALSFTDFRDLRININQSATVEVPIHPQGTMESLIKEGDDLKQFITEYDLTKDEFYQNREASVKVYADFPATGAESQPSDLLFVEVTLRYGGEAKSMTWDAQGSASTVANGGRWDVKWHKVPDENDIQWEAQVRFRDPDHTYSLSGTSDKTQFNIPVPLPGRAHLQLTEAGIPWDIIQSVEVNVNYLNPKADLQHFPKKVLLTEKQPESTLDEVIWAQWEPPFQIKPTYMLKNGTILGEEDPAFPVGSDFYIVHSPFKEWLDVPLQTRWVNDDDWREDLIDLEYRDEANNYFRHGQITLSKEGGHRLYWALPLIDPGKRTFRYYWMRFLKDGSSFTSADISGSPPDGWLSGEGNKPLEIGDPLFEGDMLRVDFSKLIFLTKLADGSKVSLVNLHIKYKDPATGAEDQDDVVLDNSDPKPYKWRQFIRKPIYKKYTWWAEYEVTDPAYREIVIPPTECEAETVVLKPPAA